MARQVSHHSQISIYNIIVDSHPSCPPFIHVDGRSRKSAIDYDGFSLGTVDIDVLHRRHQYIVRLKTGIMTDKLCMCNQKKTEQRR